MISATFFLIIKELELSNWYQKYPTDVLISYISY